MSEVVFSFTCERKVFADVLAKTFRAAPSVASAGATAGVLVSGNGNGLTFAATDGQVAIVAEIEGDVAVAGECVLHRLVGEIVRACDGDVISVAVDSDGRAEIRAGRAKFSLRTYQRCDFPDIPVYDGEFTEIDKEGFTAAVNHAVSAASTDRARPILNGVLCEPASTGGYVLVATDSYRLALCFFPDSIGGELTGKVLLPARGLAEVARLAAATSDSTIGVAALGNRTVFRVASTTISVARVEGEFPAYERLLSNEYQNRLEISKKELENALQRVRVMARDAAPVRIALSENSVVLSTVDAELSGEASEELTCSYTGEPMTIAFNPGYLRGGINACTGETVVIQTVTELKPALITDPSDSTFQYLLMPVRI